ncbi:NADPH-dependent FMN reductase [Microtetraspora niveoalba]|uniref:NADPH-dependent FMN reductase n=1 Tax=Microtetraspora niveoalba TaxID=46175 RepID=UPI0008314767|nr:NAD(P)H-dependent oxidoreductase [Microtetraspora niveoalba]
MTIVTLVGNPRAGSRTLDAAVRASEAVAARIGAAEPPEIVDLAGLAPHLFGPQPSASLEIALELVLDADVLVVAGPTYKGAYTGLLKAFLDRLPHRALEGTFALPLLVMGDPKHSLAVEVHLRPLLVELGAIVPTPGLALLESRIPDLDEVLAAWLDQVAPQLVLPQEVTA